MTSQCERDTKSASLLLRMIMPMEGLAFREIEPPGTHAALAPERENDNKVI